MHYSINPEEIKTEIVKLGHTVTNIWNIIQHRTKLPLSMSFVEMKPAPNNKDIFNAEYIQQCKINLNLPDTKKDIAQCANSQRYGHTKNYCHLKPRCFKCAGDHLTKPMPPNRKIERCPLCPLWWKSSCELRGMFCLQGPTKEHIPISSFETIHSFRTNQTNPILSTRSNICSNNQTTFLRFHR
jgi:hypothetical protein